MTTLKEIALKGLNKEKQMLTLSLIGFNEQKKYSGAIDIKNRLREVDTQIGSILKEAEALLTNQ